MSAPGDATGALVSGYSGRCLGESMRPLHRPGWPGPGEISGLARNPMPFAYFDRLTPARKQVYLRSDAIERVELPPGAPLFDLLAEMERVLRQDNRAEVERLAQRLVNDLTGRLQVPRVRLRVLSVRPSGNWGELHGLYEPFDDGTPPLLTVWMRTVARRQVVAFKSFLRTILHELCHHLDYELYGLPETFHTEGFYKRESSLFYQIRGEATPPKPAAPLPPAARRRPA